MIDVCIHFASALTNAIQCHFYNINKYAIIRLLKLELNLW